MSISKQSFDKEILLNAVEFFRTSEETTLCVRAQHLLGLSSLGYEYGQMLAEAAELAHDWKRLLALDYEQSPLFNLKRG